MDCSCTYEIAELQKIIFILVLTIAPIVMSALSLMLIIMGTFLKKMIGKLDIGFDAEQIRRLKFMELLTTIFEAILISFAVACITLFIFTIISK